MSEPWRDINDPGVFFKPKPEEKPRAAATDNYQPEKKKQEEIIATLKTAQFIPDDTTDFTKPCKIKVDIDADKPSQVTFSLWANYKGKEYDLQHQIKADSSSNQSTADLKLFYVDDHYNDMQSDPGAKVDYFAKISMKGAKPITSELLTMPRSGGITLKIKLGSSKIPDDIFMLCDSTGKCLDQKALKDAKKTGANEYELKFTKVPKDTKDLIIKIEDSEKRIVGIDKEKVSFEK